MNKQEQIDFNNGVRAVLTDLLTRQIASTESNHTPISARDEADRRLKVLFEANTAKVIAQREAEAKALELRELHKEFDLELQEVMRNRLIDFLNMTDKEFNQELDSIWSAITDDNQDIKPRKQHGQPKLTEAQTIELLAQVSQKLANTHDVDLVSRTEEIKALYQPQIDSIKASNAPNKPLLLSQRKLHMQQALESIEYQKATYVNLKQDKQNLMLYLSKIA